MRKLQSLIVTVYVLMMAAPVWAQFPPELEAAYLFGGAGDQSGFGIHKSGSHVYLSGYESFSTGYFLKVDPSDGSIVWTSAMTEVMLPYSLTRDGSDLFVAGTVTPSGCGSVDGSGGTEGKVLFAILGESTGTKTTCSSFNIYPYKGGESYYSIAGTGGTYYTAGYAEEGGFGAHRYVVGKYDGSGTPTSYVTDPLTYSFASSVDLDGTGLYIAGYRRTGSSSALPELPFVAKLNSVTLAEIWRTTIDAGALSARANFYRGRVHGATLYAVGRWIDSGGDTDFLVAAFSATDGSLDWYNVFGDALFDHFIDVAVTADGRLFGVGSSDTVSDGTQAVLIELDPADGTPLSTTVFGGSATDVFYSIVAEGSDLYVTGYSNSFATPAGNVAGSYDVILHHYVLTGTIVLEKQTDPNDPNTIFVFDTSNLDPNDPNQVLMDGDSVSFPGIDPGTYRVDELLPPGWILGLVSCSVDGGTNATIWDPNDPNDVTGVDIVLGSNQTVTCTFSNRQLVANLSITKRPTRGSVQAG